MKNCHTPGPWYVVGSVGCLEIKSGEVFGGVAYVFNECDADLIKMAPQMLEMLRKLYAIEMNPEISAEIDLIIRAASGGNS